MLLTKHACGHFTTIARYGENMRRWQVLPSAERISGDVRPDQECGGNREVSNIRIVVNLGEFCFVQHRRILRESIR